MLIQAETLLLYINEKLSLKHDHTPLYVTLVMSSANISMLSLPLLCEDLWKLDALL